MPLVNEVCAQSGQGAVDASPCRRFARRNLTASELCNNRLYDGYQNLRAHAYRLPLGNAPVSRQPARARVDPAA